jgi:hypothetical protein
MKDRDIKNTRSIPNWISSTSSTRIRPKWVQADFLGRQFRNGKKQRKKWSPTRFSTTLFPTIL